MPGCLRSFYKKYNLAAKLNQIMDAIWYGIAHAAESMFKILPPVGPWVNWLFGISITVGVVFWLWYDAQAKKGGNNFMADKG